LADNVPVSVVAGTNSEVGTAQATVTLSAGTSGGQTYTIGTIVGYRSTQGYYTRNSSADDVAISFAQPLASGFITGGGYLVASSSGGTYAATAGAKLNFGFNVKVNKNGNLQGNFNAIVRRGSHVYQIKSNSTTALSVFGTLLNHASFTAKANLTDITNPSSPISLGGNLNLQVTLTDNGDPGSWTTPDTIGITLKDASQQLLFSSNWNGAATVEQAVAGGNLVAHHAQLVAGGAFNGPGSTQVLTQQMLQPIVTAAIAEWQAAGVPHDALETLRDTPIRVGDLPGAYVGRESANGRILIDTNAAGYGWFVDPTPLESSEFKGTVAGPAVGHVDLLTVMVHELGHVLGIAELDNPNDVMFEYLYVGVRKVPTAADVMAAGLVPESNVSLAGQPRWTVESLGRVEAAAAASGLDPRLWGTFREAARDPATASLAISPAPGTVLTGKPLLPVRPLGNDGDPATVHQPERPWRAWHSVRRQQALEVVFGELGNAGLLEEGLVVQVALDRPR
jgi:hypothetical protein